MTYYARLVSKNWLAFLLLTLCTGVLTAQVPTPESIFGFKPGADYKMADYGQMLSFYEKLDAASPRVLMTEIGKSTNGRPIKLIFISSEKNLKNLARYREISAKLAQARIPESEAKALVQEGKAVVWFDAGLHATERAPAQMTPELAYRIATEETPEMQKVRDQVITLLVPVINPDGLELVTSWYRQHLGTPFETTSPPYLYQEYVGHDNNRDWFMLNMQESKVISHVLYKEWFPQIVHNHHQTSPAWARIFIPPFRSPVNPYIHPGVTASVNMVGSAMANRFALLNMPGAIATTNFSMWWNGGLRTAPYFHNMVGILTETAHATPTPRFYDPAKKPAMIAGLRTDGTEIHYAMPWEGGESHFRDAVDYTLEASIAVLNLAADRKNAFLSDIYKMGQDAIRNKKGAFAYLIAPNQWDPGEARNLVEILQRGGIEAHQATAPFNAGGKSFEAGTVIFYGAQPFHPYLADLMEKQVHPNQVAYPGGPPVPPYDLAGWTLPMQMGIEVVRIDSAFTATATLIPDYMPKQVGKVQTSGSGGFLFSNHQNGAFRAANDLISAGFPVQIIREAQGNFPAGSFWVAGKAGLDAQVAKLASETGVSFEQSASGPTTLSPAIPTLKVGLYKSWTASMDEGWTRWVLEQFHFDFDTLHDADIRSGDLSKYQAIILPSMRPESILHGYPKGAMPEQYTGGIELDGAQQLAHFVQKGGTLVTFDESSDLAIELLGLPVRNVTNGLSSQQFFIPGSLVRVKMNKKSPLTWGMQEEIAAFYDNSRAFEVYQRNYMGEGGEEKTARVPETDAEVVVSYASKDILMSGWANGADRYLKDKAALVKVPYGKGSVVLFGFPPQFRGQPRASYKLIFNALFQAAH